MSTLNNQDGIPLQGYLPGPTLRDWFDESEIEHPFITLVLAPRLSSSGEVIPESKEFYWVFRFTKEPDAVMFKLAWS
jgi:hypothetical protein